MVIIPCSDKDNCNEINSTENTHTVNHEDHSDETCSPFCVCSCCTTHFVINDLQQGLSFVTVTQTVYTFHTVSKTEAAIIPIWQPPKIA